MENVLFNGIADRSTCRLVAIDKLQRRACEKEEKLLACLKLMGFYEFTGKLL